MGNNNREFESKRVLVTGAGTGIGRGIALEFAREGSDIVIHYSHSSSGAESAVQEIQQMGRKARAIQADFNNIEDIRCLANQTVDFLGGLDILINNAGITMNRKFEKVTQQQFDTLYNVNIRAQFFLTQAVVPVMSRQGKGIVINISSVHAYGGMKEHTVYAGTKGAIVTYTRTLSLELIRKGIRVNAIAPGGVIVENQKKALGEKFDWDAQSKKVPAGFIATPRDMGRIAVFLASDDSRYIVGQTLLADGGQMAIMPISGDFDSKRDNVQYGKGYVPDL